MGSKEATRWGVRGFVLLCLLSCDEDSSVGLALGKDQVRGLVAHKRLILPVRTQRYTDSLSTWGSGLLTVGRYEDPALGLQKAYAFMHPKERNLFQRISENDVMDSLTFVLEATYRQGQKATDQSFLLYELNEALESEVGEGETKTQKEYFAHDFVDYAPENLVGELKRRSFYTSDEVLEIYYLRLPAENPWASTFFNRIFGKDTDIFTVLKSFVLVPKEENTAVLGFRPSESLLQVHYRGINDTKTTQKKVFSFEATRFNHFTSDDKKLKQATNLHDRAYAQGGIGLFWEIDIERLKKTYDSLGQPRLNSIEVSLGPIALNQDTTRVEVNYPLALRAGYLKKDEPLSVKSFLRKLMPNDFGYISRLPDDFFLIPHRNDNETKASLPYTYTGTFTLFFNNLLSPEGDIEASHLILFPEHYNRLDQAILEKPFATIDMYYHP